MTWTEWIKQYPKLEEYWQMIPEPANILFRQQIDNYANEVADTKVKNLSFNSVLADSLKPLSMDECLREEFLVNTQNYPKEYHDLFNKKYNRAKERYESQ